MILRDYQCNKCGEITESLKVPTSCPKCGATAMNKMLSAPRSLNFRGRGFEHNTK